MLDRTVETLASRFMDNRCHVGLSIVVQSGSRDHFYNYGTVRRHEMTPPTTTSVYELASVTKSFTGAVAAQALIDGKMTLDSDFRENLPGAYDNLTLDGRPITLRSLATHTSGLQRDIPDTDDLLVRPDYDRLGSRLIARNRGFTQRRSLTVLHDAQLRSKPGEVFAYSNVGTRVIGYGLEKAYRRPFPALLQRTILGPLGMDDTGFVLTPRMRMHLVTPYSRSGRAQPYHDATAGAAYGLYSTPRDMARYLRWQLDERNVVVSQAHALIRGNKEDGQGLIWNIGLDGGQRMLWHGGGTFGMTSQIVLYPEQGEGFVLLANDACANTESDLKALAMQIHRVSAGHTVNRKQFGRHLNTRRSQSSR